MKKQLKHVMGSTLLAAALALCGINAGLADGGKIVIPDNVNHGSVIIACEQHNECGVPGGSAIFPNAHYSDHEQQESQNPLAPEAVCA